MTHTAVAQKPFEKMETELQTICGAFSLEKTAPQGYSHLDTAQAGAFEVVTVRAGEMKVIRDSTCLRREDNHRFGLVLQDVGSANMVIDSQQSRLDPGDVMLVDTSKNSEFIFSGKSVQHRVVHLERDDISLRYHNEIRDGIVWSHENPLSIALRAVVQKLTSEMQSATSSGKQHVTHAFYDLLGAALSERHSQVARVRKVKNIEWVLAEGQKHIDQKFRDPDLCIADIATALNVTTRQLQRAFKLIDETPQQRLLLRRLEWARDRLIRRNSGVESGLVATIAYDAGFNDLSYFNRAFKNLYQTSPGRYTAQES